MDLNRLVSYSLRIGVLVSACLSLVGILVWVVEGNNTVSIASGSEVVAAMASALQGSASGLVYLAVAVLIATPVFRVALSSVYFANAGDRKYVVITLAVLSMLLFALFSSSSG